MSLEERFLSAAEDVKKLKQTPSEDEMLAIYALYKQAKFGDCDTPKPGILDFVGKAKWQAWNDLKGTAPDSAKEEYISKVNDLKGKYGLT